MVIYILSRFFYPPAPTTTRRAASCESSWPSASSSVAWKRVSMYSLAKGFGTEIVRESEPRATAVTASNHTLREEASISSSARSRTRPQSSSAAGSGGGGGEGSSRCGPGSCSCGASAIREYYRGSWAGSGGSGRA